jgi:hypothetical protein
MKAPEEGRNERDAFPDFIHRGMGLDKDVALTPTADFPVRPGGFIGHVSPEAMNGGLIVAERRRYHPYRHTGRKLSLSCRMKRSRQEKPLT